MTGVAKAGGGKREARGENGKRERRSVYLERSMISCEPD